jgi:hypothetical protein
MKGDVDMQNRDLETSKPGEPITFSQRVEASKEKVWREISKPGNLTDFHPFCKSNPVEIWPGEGSRDKIYYYSGLVLVREFISWIEGEGYDLIASAEDGMRFKVSWRITEEEHNQSCLNLSIRPYILGNSEKRMRQYSRLLGKYLDQVLQGFEYYMRTGKPVTRNQFGSHRWFSPPVPQEVNK